MQSSTSYTFNMDAFNLTRMGFFSWESKRSITQIQTQIRTKCIFFSHFILHGGHCPCPCHANSFQSCCFIYWSSVLLLCSILCNIIFNVLHKTGLQFPFFCVRFFSSLFRIINYNNNNNNNHICVWRRYLFKRTIQKEEKNKCMLRLINLKNMHSSQTSKVIQNQIFEAQILLHVFYVHKKKEKEKSDSHTYCHH